MSYLKISPNLFLGKQEIEQLIAFLDNDGYRRLLRNNTETYGLIVNDNNFIDNDEYINFKARNSIIPNSIELDEGIAIDSAFRTIVRKTNQFNNPIVIPADNQWYWLRIRHQYSPIEEGTVSIDSSGNLVGVGTSFTKILRGGSDYPSKIRFTNATNNTLEYTVVEVNSDTSAVLNGIFTAETDLQFKVIGTFDPNIVPSPLSKDIFQYDNCEVSLVIENPQNSNTPDYGAFSVDEVFFIYRVKNDGVNITIQDKRSRTQGQRSQFFQLKSDFELKRLRKVGNNLFGVENIKYNTIFSTRTENILQIGWGFRSSNWTFNSSTNEITINSGNGGSFKSVNSFTDGNFDGWRLYVGNGNYATILSSRKVASTIVVKLDLLNPKSNLLDTNGDFFTNEPIIIVPDAESIEIRCVPNVPDVNTQVERSFDFNISKGYDLIQLAVFRRPECYYSIYYRFKHIREYSPWFDISNGVFYNENGYDDSGNPTPAFILDPSLFEYSYVQGGIRLLLGDRNYNDFNLGDVFGIQYRNIENANRYVSLTVGSDKQHQVFQSTDVLSDNYYIAPQTSNAREGNRFIIDIDGFFNFNGAFNLIIKQNATLANPSGTGTTVASISWSELRESFYGQADTKFYLVLTFDGTNWKVSSLQKKNSVGSVPIGGIIMWSGALSQLPPNWALCDGSNFTPDLRNRFIVGAEDTYTIGDTGGADEVTLNINQIPPHSHDYSARWGTSFTDDPLDSPHASTQLGGAEFGRTNTTASQGGGLPHENRPPYFALAFIQRKS